MASLKNIAIKNAAKGVSGPRLLREVAYERLKEAIRDGDLPPGEALSETRLSDALDLSRTPIREALQQLAQEGLVQNTPHRGMTVSAPSVREVLDVLHVRSIVCPETARLVAESVSDESIERLDQIVGDMEEAAERGDHPSWSRAETAYHETLAEICPNKVLGELALQMRNRIHHLIKDSLTTPARLVACTAEQRVVADAIMRRDPQDAYKSMKKHLDERQTSFFGRLA